MFVIDKHSSLMCLRDDENNFYEIETRPSWQQRKSSLNVQMAFWVVTNFERNLFLASDQGPML